MVILRSNSKQNSPDMSYSCQNVLLLVALTFVISDLLDRFHHLIPKVREMSSKKGKVGLCILHAVKHMVAIDGRPVHYNSYVGDNFVTRKTFDIPN